MIKETVSQNYPKVEVTAQNVPANKKGAAKIFLAAPFSIPGFLLLRHLPLNTPHGRFLLNPFVFPVKELAGGNGLL